MFKITPKYMFHISPKFPNLISPNTQLLNFNCLRFPSLLSPRGALLYFGNEERSGREGGPSLTGGGVYLKANAGGLTSRLNHSLRHGKSKDCQ